MKFLKLSIILLMVLMSKMALSQYKNDPTVKGMSDTIRVSTTNIDNELVPWVVIPEITITDTRLFKSPEEKAKFNRLRYNVLKVLPYAMYARRKYSELQVQLNYAKSRKDKRVLIKTFEGEIKNMFNKAITQGGILIKLIDRETGASSYDLLKDMKGGITAFFYQSIARFFGNNLKNTYDPQQDRDIEAIIQATGLYSYSYL